ncbi:MBL fold metallo-hydrolase RNA specificity domain-containing protein [Cellulomonas soli]|uniref:MBL fold metallo-hydrolase n=1 Tax=Cellulomonas soli TaxID=931535 RepID=A0A512PAI4_9CELL|nr:MBL fold metallo-hydrolase [Cellulomonas soli]NYI60693.1 metallo-beta-lactamase family protein [Cellulomonas soli]GEP68208.1 MBL fold metallo-hydrolase [Cellulomonas soli]
MQRPTLTFLGAAGTVTGSKFLFDTGGARLLVDCGMFQGEQVWRRRNWEPSPVDPASIDAVVLTHAHLDHCGWLPVLARDGFTGPVLCTPDTARLAAIVMRDAAHVQEADAEHAETHGFSKHSPALPLYRADDAERAVALLHPVDGPAPLPGGASVRLRSAGHILGSAFAELDLSGTRVMVSGDVGRPGHALLLPPQTPADADVVLVESTYGGRTHDDDAHESLVRAITTTAHRGGTVLIPAFAVDRTAVLLLTLAALEREERIPHLPVYVDSPMALRALEVYRDAIARHDPQIRPEIGTAEHLFAPRHLQLMSTREESEQLNRPDRTCIVISASGMATGGRVLHHLAAQLPDRRNTVVLTGFQVPGTRGWALAEGARQIKIHGRYVPVEADVVVAGGFSAHADADQLVAWLRAMAAPETAYVVHGEQSAADTFARRLGDELGWNAVVPRHHEKVLLPAADEHKAA